jgi:hypothetical protein
MKSKNLLENIPQPEANVQEDKLQKKYTMYSKEQKLDEIAKCNFRGAERIVAEEYSKALEADNQSVIEAFEIFGNTPYHIVRNYIHFERASSIYGFTNVAFDDYGWLARGEFSDCETFNFGCGGKSGVVGSNSITIGRGPNGKWTYGISLAVSLSGQCYGLSVFNEPYDSRRACLRHGLEDMIAWHTKENDKKAVLIIKEVKDMLDEITGRKPKQLTLF